MSKKNLFCPIGTCPIAVLCLAVGTAQAKSPQKGGLPAVRADLDHLVDALCDGDVENCEVPACPCFDAEMLAGASSCFISNAAAPFRGRRTLATGPGFLPIGVSVGLPNVCEYAGPVPGQPEVIGPISPAEAETCRDLILDLFGPSRFAIGP